VRGKPERLKTGRLKTGRLKEEEESEGLNV
jgi:hypothetical protein